MGARNLDPYRPYQLLPPAYQIRRKAVRVAYGWGAINGCLLVGLGIVCLAVVIQTRRDDRAREQLAATAFPLFNLRRQVQDLELSNARRAEWCRWVESARPDDNALQTLAAIIDSIEPDSRSIQLDQIRLELPTETPRSSDAEPYWQPGSLELSARIDDLSTAYRWVTRLNASDRITAAAIDKSSRAGAYRRIELIATPLTTRVLP